MKAFRFFAIMVISALAFTACSEDNNELTPPTPSGGEIVFNIDIANPSTDSKTRVATDAQFKSTWENGDEIGIFAVKRAASNNSAALADAGNYIHNVKLTYNGTDWTTDAGVIHYFPNNGEVLDFYAYYPYDATATDPANITFNVSADQSTADNYNLSDLLSAKEIGVAKGTTVDLTFAHKLALVQVEVDLGTIKGSGPSENLAITLRGCLTGGAFDLSAGSLTTTGDVQAVKMLRVETDPATATTYTYRALVPAQTVAQGSSLCLMAQNGQLYNTPTLAAQLELSAGEAKLYAAELPVTALQTVKIAKGTFLMGSPDGSNGTTAEPNRQSNETQHSVTLTKDFYMSKYAITFAQYDAFCDAENKTKPSDETWGRGDRPVINVSWHDAKAYCEWISSVTGGSWRLPTEAEWEYACRAETITAYSFGADDTNIGNYAWYGGNSDTKSHPVGEKSPNSWGLYDMHGNVFEWCSDWYAVYDTNAATDPIGPATGDNRVFRGGFWFVNAQYCRSAFRDDIDPDFASDFIGFRVVFVP